MSAVARRHGHALTGLPSAAARVEQALLGLACAALAVLAVLVVATPSSFGLPSLADTDTAGRVAAAAAVYAASHVLRFLRLAALVHHPSIRLRRVLQVHLLTTGLGVLLPFKLGDLVRVREVGVVTGSLRTGLLAVWLERAMDAAVLVLLVLAAAAGAPGALGVLTPLLALMAAFVGVTVVLVAVVPANLRGLMLHIVRRPSADAERGVRVLRVLRAVLDALHQVPVLLRGKVPTLLLLTALIWTAEALTVSVALGVELRASELSAGVLALLASISSGATALSAAAGERLVDALQSVGAVADPAGYRLVLALTALVAGAWAGATYLPRRRRA